jgi:hypothetical protein
LNLTDHRPELILEVREVVAVSCNIILVEYGICIRRETDQFPL